MQCKDAIHSLDPWELRHATNLGSCSGLRDATGGIAGGGGSYGGDVFYFFIWCSFLMPRIYVFVCIFFIFFFQDTLNQLAGSISGILQPIVSR